MTDTTVAPKPAGTGYTTPGLTPEENTKPEPTDAPESANSEAAKYRKQLRTTEAERDTLTGRLERAQRTMIEGIAAKHLAKPEALWVSGAEIADLLDDDGNVDDDKVAAAVKDVQERFGLERPVYGPIIPGQGDTPTHKPQRPAFADAFTAR
jgi:hypothetical protein